MAAHQTPLGELTALPDLARYKGRRRVGKDLGRSRDWESEKNGLGKGLGRDGVGKRVGRGSKRWKGKDRRDGGMEEEE